MAVSEKNHMTSNESSLSMIQKKLMKAKKILCNLSCSQDQKRAKKDLELLSQNDLTIQFLKKNSLLTSFFEKNKEKLTLSEQLAFFAILALEQGEVVFSSFCDQNLEEQEQDDLFKKTLVILGELEEFYKPLGGVVGYHCQVLELVLLHLEQKPIEEKITYLAPPCTSIENETASVRKMIRDGLETLPFLAEMYAVGGAGDRLKLLDEHTKQPLPAAKLQFLSRTLFDLLIRDLEAREYLYYKLFAKKLICPIVLMTSEEKMNHQEIVKLCENAAWYGRGKENFTFIIQPLTPVITSDGDFAVNGKGELVVKPGGHGVIWKLAKDKGVFEWLKASGKEALLVRQINNPLAGVDYGLLALSGYGMSHKMSFGFASCPRKEGAQEGMNVLEEKENGVAISNLEYTEFSRLVSKNMQKERFPANTNILFARIDDVEKASEVCPIPGMLVNMKTVVQTVKDGKAVTTLGARLESTMQNIADVFSARSRDLLKVFIVLNTRSKTISVAKKAYEGQSIFETPEGAFYDLLQESYRLLKDHCKVELDAFTSEKEYMETGPSMLFSYHPALGPLYSIIAQKIRKGHFEKGSELLLEIAEVDIENLHLQGSCLVYLDTLSAHNKSSAHNKKGSAFMDEGQVFLKNCTIKNKGIDRSLQNSYWKGQIKRLEAFEVRLEPGSSFVAEDVVFEGSFSLTVPSGMRATVRHREDKSLQIDFEPHTEKNVWHWNYSFDQEDHIVLNK